jgi:hypothetical protein
MSNHPELRAIDGGPQKNEKTPSMFSLRRFGALALPGVVAVAAFSVATQPKSIQAQPNGIYRAPIKLKALEADKQVTTSLHQGELGIDDMIANVEPGILTDNPNLKTEVENYMAAQMPDSANLQTGDTAQVPIVTTQQIRQANNQ